MHNQILYFWVITITISLVSLIFVYKNLVQTNRSKVFIFCYSLFSLAFIGLSYNLYFNAGNYTLAVNLYQPKAQEELAKQQRLRPLLSQLRKEELKLRLKVERNPKDAKAWVALGKLYMTKHTIDEAVSAFKIAYAINPNDPQIAVDYISARSYLGAGRLDSESKKIIKALSKNKIQIWEIDNLVALDCFQRGQFTRAISKWDKILSQYSLNSSNREIIKNFRAKAASERELAKI